MEANSSNYSIPQTTIDRLLASQTPSIRYFSYKNLLNLADDHPLVIATRTQIADADHVKTIIAAQDTEGYWYSERHYYGPKYRSSHWSMLLLSELAVPPETPALQRGADFMIRRMFDEQHVYYAVSSYMNKDQSGFCCYWGNWLRYQLYCGRGDHPLVQEVIDIVSADVTRKGRCLYNQNLPCAWGVIRSLFGLALIPAAMRTSKIRDAIQQGIGFILDEHDLTAADYPTPGTIHPIWHKTSFPLFYQADILFTLRVLAEVKALNHSGAQKALRWLESKRKADGTWRASSPFKSRSHPFLSEGDTPDRWVTLQTLSVLTAANRKPAE